MTRALDPRRILLLVPLAFLALTAGGGLLADGFIYVQWPDPFPRPVPPPHPGPWIRPVPRPNFPLQVTKHRVEVKIDDSVARTHVEETFYNPNSTQLEGTYLFPLPAGASISKFSMLIGGKEVAGEVLEKDKARTIYESIVRQSRDPGLLEFVERGLFRARVFPIPPIGNVEVRVEYEEAIPVTNGFARYRYPLNTGKYSAGDYNDVLVDVTVKTSSPLRSVTPISHPASVTRNGDKEARVVFEAKTLTADKDFVLDWNVGEDALAPVLLVQRTHEPDGFFYLTIMPRADKPAKIPAKDLVAVIDTSGSMLGPKMDEAKKALKHFVNGLHPGDRFGIVDFSTEARKFRDGLVEASDDTRKQALSYVDDLQARGGTNMEEALSLALKTLGTGGGDDHLKMVVLITDGEPTVGIVRTEDILKSVKDKNPKAWRVFAFGVGTDLNAQLLERVTSENHGSLDYVMAEENLEVKLSNFWDKVDSPVLTDIRIEFPNLTVADVYPKPLPDLFKGETLAVTGRFREEGKHPVVLRGKFLGEEKVFEYSLDFGPRDLAGVAVRNDFIPRLWATRKIGYLLEAMRTAGESKEVKDEVIRLSQQYGILTPYTSYLILEDSARRIVTAPGRDGVTLAMPAREALRDAMAPAAPAAAGVPADEGALMARRELSESASGAGRDFKAERGADAVKASGDMYRLKKAGEVAGPAGMGGGAGGADRGRFYYDGAEAEGKTVGLVNRTGKRIQQVASRAFYLQGDRWVEGGLTEKELGSLRKVAYLSDEYFDLLAKNAGIGELLSVGDKVTFRWKDQTIAIE